MMNENERLLDYVNKASMEIILHAGDARNIIYTSIEYLTEKNYSAFQSSLEEAHVKIKKAHKVQTQIIQEEFADDVQLPHTLLFAHAQDTLMTIYSEYNLVSRLGKVFIKFEEES